MDTNNQAIQFGTSKWTIELDGNNLLFKYNGTAKIKFADDGEIVTVDDVTAFGTKNLMAIPSSGAVSFSDLRTEFVGGSAAISISSLYRGGSNIRTKASNNNGVNLAASVPTSGTITLDNFRGTAKAFRYTYTSGATNQDASNLFGDDYAVNYPKEIVINAGVELGATTVTQEALQINSGASGGITVTNNGTISGAGAAFLGSVGGDAFEANTPAP